MVICGNFDIAITSSLVIASLEILLELSFKRKPSTAIGHRISLTAYGHRSGTLAGDKLVDRAALCTAFDARQESTFVDLGHLAEHLRCFASEAIACIR